MAIRDQQRRLTAAQIEQKPERNKKNRKSTSDTKSEYPSKFLTKIENQMLKTENPQNAMINKTVKPTCFGTTAEKPI